MITRHMDMGRCCTDRRMDTGYYMVRYCTGHYMDRHMDMEKCYMDHRMDMDHHRGRCCTDRRMDMDQYCYSL